MATYGLSDTHLLQMPVRRFWLLEKNITRMQAERELRQLPIVLAPNAKDSVQELAGRLSQELGSTVTVHVAKRDADATQRLAKLAGQR